MLISLVQRHTALSSSQQALLEELSTRSEHNFKRLDDIEWVVTKEKLEAITRALTQRRRAKRDAVDRRDDDTIKGTARRRAAR